MPQTINQVVKSIDAVVDWLAHNGFNIRAIASVTNDTTVRAEGSTLMGMVLYSADNGATWKVIASGDNLAAAGLQLAIAVPDKLLTAQVASGGAITNIQALRIGPARVNKAGLNVNGAVAATVYAQLEKQSIQVVDSQSGALYAPTFGA